MTNNQRPFSDRVRDLFNGRELQTLEHALEVAAERFDADKETMIKQKAASEEAIAAGQGVLFHPRACLDLAAQFERQAAQTRELLYKVRGDDELDVDEEADRQLAGA